MLVIRPCPRYDRPAMSVHEAETEDSLMSSEELAAQKVWDQEFQRRREDLARQELKSRERSRQVSAKMSELKQRWEGVERRRMVRSRQGTLSLILPSRSQLTVPATSSMSHHSNDNNNNNVNTGR